MKLACRMLGAPWRHVLIRESTALADGTVVFSNLGAAIELVGIVEDGG